MPQLLKKLWSPNKTHYWKFTLVLIMGLAFWGQHFASKKLSKQVSRQKNFIAACKNLKALSISITPDSDLPESNEAEVTLTANFKLQSFTANAVKYQWNLPEGVSVVSGELKGILESSNLGSPLKASIRVSGFSKEEFKQITISARLQKNGKDLQQASAILSSDPEKTWEHYGVEMSYVRDISE